MKAEKTWMQFESEMKAVGASKARVHPADYMHFPESTKNVMYLMEIQLIPDSSMARGSVQFEHCESETPMRDIIEADLKHMAQDDEDYDSDFLKPTLYARAVMSHWLNTLLLLNREMPKPSLSPDGTGGIRAEWFGPDMSFRLVIGSDVGEMSYFHERQGDDSWIMATRKVISRDADTKLRKFLSAAHVEVSK